MNASWRKVSSMSVLTVSDFVPRFVDFGVHPLLALMAIHATYPAAKKMAQEKVGAGQN
jgi:hypothetical protein